MTKNRLEGMLSVTFPDGYVEKCFIKTKLKKDAFIEKVRESLEEILNTLHKNYDENNDVKISYEGDLSEETHSLVAGEK